MWNTIPNLNLYFMLTKYLYVQLKIGIGCNKYIFKKGK